jgi:hypothetical protein
MARRTSNHGKPERFATGASHTTSIKFHTQDFLSVVTKLHRKYPGEWVALAIGDTDEESGLTVGRLIAHSPAHKGVLQAVSAFRDDDPDTQVRVFSTDLANA